MMPADFALAPFPIGTEDDPPPDLIKFWARRYFFVLRIAPAAFLASLLVKHGAPPIEEIISLMHADASSLSATASARWLRRRWRSSLVIGLRRESLSAQARCLHRIHFERFLTGFGNISAALIGGVTLGLRFFHLDLLHRFRCVVCGHVSSRSCAAKPDFANAKPYFPVLPLKRTALAAPS
jgi:hypothetical protein